MQGVLGGVTMAAGYLIGRAMLWLWRYMGLPEPRGRAAIALRLAVLAPALGLAAWCLAHAAPWQDSIRERVGLGPVEGVRGLQIVLIAAAVFGLLVLIG